MASALARARALIFCGLVTALLLSGCATTNNNPRDPLEGLNRGVYFFNDVVDNLFAKPAATIYQGVVPQIARTGVSNFFANIMLSQNADRQPVRGSVSKQKIEKWK